MTGFRSIAGSKPSCRRFRPRCRRTSGPASSAGSAFSASSAFSSATEIRLSGRPGVNVRKLFSSSVALGQNKLERVYLKGFCRLIQYLRVKPGVYPHQKMLHSDSYPCCTRKY
jgi:hypothetical protein